MEARNFPTADETDSIDNAMKPLNAFDEGSFLRSKPVTAEECGRAKAYMENMMNNALSSLEERGFAAYEDWKESSCPSQPNETERLLRLLEESPISGEPRRYQSELVEVAKKQNAIVHLGTGSGKTLIAIMVIKHFAPAFKEGKQSLFLVPSVVLAHQQGSVLQANLPYTIKVTCNSTKSSEQARKELREANVIVATHGAIRDMLTHYGDTFSMGSFNVLVMDECHYATGNHAYATIMKSFYHPLPPEKRPRVLGLTASPLLNVKETQSDARLGELLEKLESVVDAKVIPVSNLASPDYERLQVRRSVVEHHVAFSSEVHCRKLPSYDNIQVHESRKRELRQIHDLYPELGPLPLSIYVRTVAREMSRNTFERETVDEFNRVVDHCNDIASFCELESSLSPLGGRSDKVLQLEALLEDEIEDQSRTDAVGLVFVERRVTALALHDYFRHRQEAIKNRSWLRAKAIRERRNPPGFVGSSSSVSNDSHTNESSSISSDSGNQFEDADEDVDEPLAELDAHVPKPTESHGKRRTNFQENFMDADEDITKIVLEPLVKDSTALDSSSSNGSSSLSLSDDKWETASGQFLDADELDELSSNNFEIDVVEKQSIRCQAFVRRSTQVFKNLSMSKKRTISNGEGIDKSWLHHDLKVKDVLNGLRNGEINVLITTSVVEEGVDVQGCSFVIVFDSLTNIKGYTQMKGRARQRDAKFFVFHDIQSQEKSGLSLESAQNMERRVQDFISSRESTSTVPVTSTAYHESQKGDGEYSSAEIDAVEMGFYKTESSSVDLHVAKSLINRYALALPLDPVVRFSKVALMAHLPVYDENHLILPSHLPRDVREIRLPSKYYTFPSREKEKMMALMACVRLHSRGLLSQRLLPLARKDLQEELLSLICAQKANCSVKVS